MTDFELLILNSNTWNHLTVCKQMSTGSFKNVTYKLFVYTSHIWYICKQNLALNNLQWLICHKIQPNQIQYIQYIYIYIYIYVYVSTKERSGRYPAKTITDADYDDDIALLANAPAQAETLLHSMEQAAAGIGLHVNAHNTEYMCFN